jgi:HD-GYP domain-containing protein (c-di-GMP phosphodiesterase class II)
MTSDRSYRHLRSKDQAVAELKNCAGSQFDPAVVEGFLQMLDQCLWETQQDGSPQEKSD